MTEIEANDLLGLLPDRERSAIKDRYWHKKSLYAVGMALGVSRERARQLITKGQKRLKKLMIGEDAMTPKERKARRMADHLDSDCRAYLNGEIKTQTEIAKKYGVTRACISRRVCQIRGKSGIAPTKRQITARKTYGLRQLIVAQTRKPQRPMEEALKIWRLNHD